MPGTDPTPGQPDYSQGGYYDYLKNLYKYQESPTGDDNSSLYDFFNTQQQNNSTDNPWGTSNYPVSISTPMLNSLTAPDGPGGGKTGNSYGGGSTGIAAGNLVGGLVGGYEFLKAQSELKKLDNTPYPTYSVSGELQNSYGRAEGMANQGFTAAEKAGYRADVNSAGALNYQRGVDAAGGNLANVVSAGVNSQEIAGAGKMSIADATLRRQNMQYADSIAAQIQSQKNLMSAAAIKQRELEEQAWGGASTAGLQSFANSFNIGGIASTVASAALL